MNKKRILLSVFTGAIAATSFAVFNNVTNVSASGVVHTKDATTFLFTRTGEMINTRALAPNTPWQVGDIIQVNGETLYQVSTNEFVKEGSVTYEAPNSTTPTEKPNNDQNPNAGVTVSVDLPWGAPIFDDRTQEVTNAPAGSAFKVGRIVQSDTGLVYYQVSTHGWMVGDLVKVSGNLGKVEQVYGFRPIGEYQGESADDMREALYEMGCDWDALESIPDDVINEQSTISNYSGSDIGDLSRRLNNINPNVGGL
ncbi:hypothetical protein FC72_GL001088 [Companilactobacillus tucceti DSM 20183]|uniref:Surface layer protein A domain-containing protein n=1 Tax=Companilactobacillus tucceti DSM 20183 TaxID=1423811 RepID=A0A0R1J4P3_9LACO|nr:hypothetical protein [Companilactobacillus tucceti]KRK63849.1 hypothetical protein FC72_GL001088 [Companilactobacillus tucceti DSM 20183]